MRGDSALLIVTLHRLATHGSALFIVTLRLLATHGFPPLRA
jgi:hypothetical protein